MPRTVRKSSEFGYYHLIARGNGSQVLFTDDADRFFYLSLLQESAAEFQITVCAYCLMSNHIHLLVFDKGPAHSSFMRKIDSSYAAYFNQKYQRSGHLFQDRYKSEAVEDETYLLTVFRYILNNPQKAGICPAADYKWSSYRLYGKKDPFVDTSAVEDLIGSPENYIAYIAAKNDDECMEFESEKHDDEWALSVIRKQLGVRNGIELQSWPVEKRRGAFRLLKKQGIRIRQIERLTGINRGEIQRA